MPLKRQETANGRCQATTKAGRQCAAPAVRGGTLCALHSDPERAAELGRKGGAGNRKLYQADDRPKIPAPRNASDVMTERIRVLRRLAADERIGIRYRLAAERELLRMRWAAERELLLPQVVAKLQDAATTARSRELRLVFVKALARIWRARPDLKPKALPEENQ